MSSQTVYFTNPAVISNIQSQVGTTPNQVSTSQVSLTGSLYNSLGRFVDKYTLDKGIGQYQVDCIPLVIKDTFAMPKFSTNPTSPSGGIYTPSPTGPYTVQQFDTFVTYDCIVYAPSVRTTMETTPMFNQTIAGEVDNLGSFGAPLEDYRGQISTTTNVNQFASIYGSTGLGTKMNNFYNVICSSGTTSTGARQAALNTILSDTDFITIKNQMKYPFKVYNQVKGVSDFTFTNLLDLNGTPLANTGADGNTGYFTSITTTSYSATGNLLPPSQNVNSTGGKMGLFLFCNAVGMPQWLDLYTHQIASLGYVAVALPSNQFGSFYCRYGGKKTTAQLLADTTISRTSTAPGFNGNAVSTTGYIYNASELYGSSTDSVNSGGAVNGFARLTFGSNVSVPEASIVMERYLYQIKCALKHIGLDSYIDYNNVVLAGASFGAQTVSYMNRIATTGNAVYFKQMNGTTAFLFKPKAFISYQGNHIDYSYKTGMAIAGTNNYNATNNRFIQSNMWPLKVPTIFITGEADVNGFGGNIQDSSFNNAYQTIVQMTKQQASSVSDIVLSKSAIFYRQVVKHFDVNSNSPLFPDAGQYGTIFTEGFCGDWLQGWNIPLNPSFPSIQSAYESGLLDERVYAQCVDLNINTLFQFIAHRFLGKDYPIPQDAYNTLGLRCDLGPTACDVLTDHEYMRVGPWGMLTYDYNYNLILTNVPGATGATQPPVSLYATGTNQSVNATTLSSTTLNSTNSFLINANISTGTVSNLLAANSTIISLTGATANITTATLTNSTITSLTGATASITTQFTLPVYTAAESKPAANVGNIIVISDSPTETGRLAYWNGSVWKYVSDNSNV